MSTSHPITATQYTGPLTPAGEHHTVRDTGRNVIVKPFMPYAAEWVEREVFTAVKMRMIAEAGFAGNLRGDDVGAPGLTRFDATLTFEAFLEGCVSTAAFISLATIWCP